MKTPPDVAPQAAQRSKAGQAPTAKKALGQHYLIDETVLQHILSASEVGPQDTVVEVGPGPGSLTRHLVRRAKRVIAIEIDPRFAASLPTSLGYPPNLHVINADARHVDLAQALAGEGDYKVVANLPYYAASPILRRFLETGGRRPSLMVVMLQREVARSMVAHRGRMSLLAVGIQMYGTPRIICYVPPQAFRPPPKVTSAVVRIDVGPRPAIEVEDVEGFFRVVAACFSAPRKQLRNSMSLGLGITAGESSLLLGAAGLDPMRRAENLSLEELDLLYRVVKDRWSGGNQSLCQDKPEPGSAWPAP